MPSLRNLDLNLLKVFDAIYVSGSVSGAARRLNLSQPSVSRALGRLREHFDDPLFERSGNGVSPTPKAAAMLDAVRGALSLIDSAIDSEDVFDPARHSRTFRMIMPDIAEALIMPGVLNRLPPRSNVTFEVLPYSGADLSRAFSEGEADIGVVPFQSGAEDVSYRWLFADGGALIARKGHPALRNGFSMELLGALDFAGLPEHIFRMFRLNEFLRTRGIERRVVYVTHKSSSVPRLVATTDLVAFLPHALARILTQSGELEMFDVPGLEDTKQDVYLVHGKGADDDPAIAWLSRTIADVCAPDPTRRPSPERSEAS